MFVCRRGGKEGGEGEEGGGIAGQVGAPLKGDKKATTYEIQLSLILLPRSLPRSQLLSLTSWLVPS